KIVGITAYLKDISRYDSEFRQYASIIFEARRNDVGWIESLKKIIEKDVASQVSFNLNAKNSVLITVHGIRTFAPWQNIIEDKINNFTNKFEHIKINYGFLNILCFLFPLTRRVFAKKIIQDIVSSIESNKDKRIHIICHSFGTYLVFHALNKVVNKDLRIENLILSGSVLKRDTSLLTTKKICNRIINDCAINDYVLLLCKIAVVGLGDAGRKGFIEPSDLIFSNRYFKGGHSVYFEDASFFEKNWMPVIFDNNNFNPQDERKEHMFSDITSALQNIMEHLKTIFWIALLPIIILFFI
ncbi:alpha/beta hydrolase, partial [Providencia sp. Me1]|uniref:alpha/beta hydrolase n=1 Tax=Providencia sp. Me1 TaxID=3392634 RepID=UPI003D26AB0F